jgi:hypothetical protein
MSFLRTIRPSPDDGHDGFDYIVEFTPAWDRTDPDPTKNYGVQGVELRMVLKGDRGAVQFVLYTGWMLDMIPDGTTTFMVGDPTTAPLPADLGYHSPKPMYDGHTMMDGPCEYLDGAQCYYDGSGLNAQRIWNTLVREGSNGVWRDLREYYRETFNVEED